MCIAINLCEYYCLLQKKQRRDSLGSDARPDFEPSEDLEREEVERTEETSERSEVEPREEVLFRGLSRSETKSHKWRKDSSHPTNTHFSLAKLSKNAMMSSISPSEDQTGSKAKKS